MIIYQEVVTGDTKYSVANQANLVVFDIHNDSPYSMGVSFGSDTGIGNADYYTSAHSILYGIGPIAVQQRSINGVKWTGTIYIYTQTPAGGGSTNLSSAPASQITVIGYPAGYNPSGTTSLSRMSNIGNPVSTNVSSTNSILNTGNPPLTSIISATPSDASSPTWAADTSGNLTIKSDNAGTLTPMLQITAGASQGIVIGSGNIFTEFPGPVSVDSNLVGNYTIRSSFGSYYGTDGNNSILASSGTSGTGETFLQNTDKISLQVPNGTDIVTLTNTLVEVLKNAQFDGSITVASGIRSSNGAYYGTDASNTILQSSGSSGTGNTRLQNTDHISIQVPGGTEAIGVNSSQVTVEKSLIFTGQLGVSTAGDVIDASSGADTYIKCRSTGNINFQSPNGTTVAHFDTSGFLNLVHSLNLPVGSLGQLSKFTGTGNGTVATGVTNPTSIAFNPCTASGSTQTIGGTIASSSVVTTGAGLAWAGTAWHS